MGIRRSTLVFGSGGRMVVDLTPMVQRRLGCRRGIVIVVSRTPGVAVTTLEYEPRLVEDLMDLAEKLGRGVAAAALGSEAGMVIVDGRLAAGTFQQLVAVDLSGEPGEKAVEMVVLCEDKGGGEEA